MEETEKVGSSKVKVEEVWEERGPLSVEALRISFLRGLATKAAGP